MGIETAVLISAAVGAGSAYYQSERAEDAQAAAMREQKKAEEEAEKRRLAEGQNQATSESATTEYGVDKSVKRNETSNDLLIPKPTQGIGTSSTRTGIGF